MAKAEYQLRTGDKLSLGRLVSIYFDNEWLKVEAHLPSDRWKKTSRMDLF